MPNPNFHLTDTQEPDVSQYRALSALAVAGLILGCLSVAAMFDPLLWCVPAVGVLVCGLALRQIARNSALQSGRGLALAGLLLCVLLGTAAPVDWLVYRRMIRAEARQFAALWFQYLEQDAPQKAYQLAMHPRLRQPLDDNLWDYYRHNAGKAKQLQIYVQAPLLRTLLALGPKADVRYYGSGGHGQIEEGETVDLVYAISYDTPEGTKTFFANLGLERTRPEPGHANWRLAHAEAGFRPAGW